MSVAGLFRLDARPAFLLARFPRGQRMLSWSLNRPGFTSARQVAFVEVRDADLPEGVCPTDLLARRLAEEGAPEAVGLLTSRDVRRHHVAAATVEGVSAACLVTLGLNNGERVGERVKARAPAMARTGTVNILAAASHPLSDGALLEALSMVVQARTLAILEAGFRRPGLQGPVTGTGTDCVVVSAPAGEGGLPFAGLHTALGEALGAAVLSATRAAAAEWMAERVGTA